MADRAPLGDCSVPDCPRQATRRSLEHEAQYCETHRKRLARDGIPINAPVAIRDPDERLFELALDLANADDSDDSDDSFEEAREKLRRGAVAYASDMVKPKLEAAKKQAKEAEAKARAEEMERQRQARSQAAKEGLAKAKAEGKAIGRPRATTTELVLAELEKAAGRIRAAARALNVDEKTVRNYARLNPHGALHSWVPPRLQTPEK